MSAADLPLILALPVLLGLSAVASGSETALFSLTHAERQRLRRTAPVAYGAVQRLTARPRRLLILVLLLNMLVNVTYFVITSVLTLRAENPATAAAVSAVTLLAVILFGEVLAKLLAARNRVAFCRFVAAPLLGVAGALAPVLVGLERFVIAPLARLIHPHEPVQAPGRSAVDDLAGLVEHAGRQGVLSDEERRLLGQIVHLGLRRVWDVMTPRVDLVWVGQDATPEEVLAIFREHGHAKYPVRSSGGDGPEAVGLLSAKRYVGALARGVRNPLRASLEPARFVPDGARLDRLLAQFRETRSHVALAVNELGEVTGLVEIEDVADELLAGLTEHAGDEAEVRMVGLGRWQVPGRLPIRDWVSFFEVGAEALSADARAAIEGSRFSTVGGLIGHQLGRVPEVGDRVDVGNVTLEVERMEGRSVASAVVSLGAARPAGGERSGQDGAGGDGGAGGTGGTGGEGGEVAS